MPPLLPRPRLMRISLTLSWYILKDMLRIFLMASGALAGVMSFGGLLRPLTQQGLDAVQVGQLLTYFTPAMTAYSFPIAALFATTMVYGRLSADNELTACRAAGISLLTVAVPAFVLGSLAALVSFVFLSFVVPASTLKAEKVIYSNIAKVIASQIQRSHQISFPGSLYTVFAQQAYLPPAETLKAGEQKVVLVGPTIVKFERPFGRDDWQYKIPTNFWTASSATAYINETGDTSNPQLTVALSDGMSFPRDLSGKTMAVVGATQFGPIPIQSPIKENTKFMDLRQLKQLYLNNQESQKVRDFISDFLRHDQEYKFLAEVRETLNATHRYVFHAARGEDYLLSFGEDVVAAEKGGELTVRPVVAPGQAPPSARRIRVQRSLSGRLEAVTQAREVLMRVTPRRGTGQIDVNMRLADALTQGDIGPAANEALSPTTAPTTAPSPPQPRTLPAIQASYSGPGAGAPTARAMLPVPFKVAMPPEVQALENRPLDYYVSPAAANSGNVPRLKHQLAKLNNDIVSEMHVRAAFAISCVILVMVGCALGMMFRSGNFLTAFAVSFVPALLAITLIIAGQQVCGNMPFTANGSAPNPLNKGIAFIWSGNALNFALAVGLLWKLART